MGKYDHVNDFTVNEIRFNDLEKKIKEEFVDKFHRTYYPSFSEEKVINALTEANPIVYETDHKFYKKISYNLEPYNPHEVWKILAKEKNWI
jgi:hypothetical protein